MKILVTGAAGFTAEHLIPALKLRGHKIIGTDRLAEPSADVDLFFQTELSNISEYAKYLIGVDLIIHLAAARADWGVADEEFYNDNVVATKALLATTKDLNIKKFIFVSSIAVMPQNSKFCISEQSAEDPKTAYGKSKLLGERLIIESCESD